MKRRIIALLMATVSAASLLASCDGDATACKQHVDLDTNSVCDLCGKEIVVVSNTQQLQKEEKVPTVRKEIPTDVKIGDFINWDVMMGSTSITGKAEKVEKPDLSDKTILWDEEADGIGYFVVYGGEGASSQMQNHNTYLITYVWYSYDYEVMYTKTVEDDARQVEHAMNAPTHMGEPFEFNPIEYRLDYAFVMGGELPVVVEGTWNENYFGSDPEQGYDYKYTYYTPNGEPLVSFVKAYNDYEFEIPVAKLLKSDKYYAYIEIDGTVYAFDMKTLDMVYSGAEETFIYRPNFTAVINGYGYVEYDATPAGSETDVEALYVYNLTGEKWIDCVYEKDLSDFNGDYYLLNNGNYLYQTEKVLPSDAVNFDYIVDGAKYDVTHVIVDVTTGEETEVEFGWYISDLSVVNGNVGFVEEVGLFAGIIPVAENGMLNFNEEKVVLMDNEMNILIAIQDRADATLAGLQPVNKNVYMAAYYNGGVDQEGELESIIKYVDADMKEIDVTGFEVAANGKYLTKDNKIYAWSDLTNAKLDGANYQVVSATDNFAILKDAEVEEGATAKYYYFNLNTLAAPVELQGTYYTCNGRYDYYIVEKDSTREDLTGAGPLKDYVMYDCNNQVIGTFSDTVKYVNLEQTYWEITLTNGEVWKVAHDMGLEMD